MRTPILWRQIILAAACVAGILMLIGSSESFESCVKNRKNLQSYKALHEEGPFFVKYIVRLKLNAACGRVTLGESDGAITAFATIVLAIFTCGLWISTNRLWIAGERQADFNKTMADAAVLAQRARVQITPTWETDASQFPWVWGQTPPAPQYKFGSRMDNVGQMPASNLRNRIDFILTEGDLPEDFIFPDELPHLSEGGLLGTKQFLFGPHVPPDRYITAEEIAKMRNEQLRLYLFGWVKYIDGFSNTPIRTTKFCYWVRVTGNVERPTVFIPHKLHNSAD